MAVRFGSVDEYVAAQPMGVRGVLEQVRGAILRGVPEAEESISYNIPTYKLNGLVVIYFAGWKAHYSLYPCGKNVVAEFSSELAGYKVEKSTVRFPFGAPVPASLIERLAAFRALEVAGRV